MSNRDGRPRALAVLLLALVFGVGLLAGIAVDRLLLVPRGAIASEAPPPVPSLRGPAAWGERIPPHRAPDGRYLDVIARELQLSDEQRARVEAILRRQQERVMEITRDSRPQLRALTLETRAAIDEVLTPEQRARFQELRGRRDRHGRPLEQTPRGTLPTPPGNR